jgi:uncharacterized protein DUF6982
VLNKVVARFADGRIVKGFTADFVAGKDSFHVSVNDGPGSPKPLRILVGDLKAVFFVKDLVGNPDHKDKKEFDPASPTVGRKIRVQFKDGEVLVGTTQGYQPGRPGFFLMPADKETNIERCYVVGRAATKIEFV